VRAHAAANRERILHEAEIVFGDRGAGGSTEEIAERAGVGIATVFRHFPTKEALLQATLVRHFDAVRARAVALAEDPDAGRALQALIRTMVESGSTKLALGSVLGDATPSPELKAAADGLRSMVREALQRAVEAGNVRPDVGVDEVYLLVRGLAQATTERPPSRATLEGAVAIVLAGIRS
jgi:AcrR family transcriptional regulator